jgi:hypothetical protein
VMWLPRHRERESHFPRRGPRIAPIAALAWYRLQKAEARLASRFS